MLFPVLPVTCLVVKLYCAAIKFQVVLLLVRY